MSPTGDSCPAGLSLAKIDELLDAVEPQGPRFIYGPEGMVERLREAGRRLRARLDALGYSDLRSYHRDLAALGAFHGPRLAWRLEVAVLDRVLERERAARRSRIVAVSIPTEPDGLQP